MTEPSAWWTPHAHADRRGFLRQRAGIVAALRGWFAAAGFIEADTAALQVSPGNEAHISAFSTEITGPDGDSSRLFLHSSPEFACKKLLAAGETRLFTLGHVFRNGERGPLHHPEFTMLEWYRAGEGPERAMADCAALLAAAARAAGTTRLVWRGAECDPLAPPERMSVTQAFMLHAGVDLGATLSPSGDGSVAALAVEARRLGLRVTADDAWSDLFSKILSAFVEPRLGHGRPTLLHDYPACEAALARRKRDDPRFSERFELYACGVELANGFGELTDAAEQRRRFEAEEDERARVYGERYPIDEDFLAALALMPEASGVAMGLDRLVMLCAGARHIEQVIWTPVAARGAAR
jgi:lysyl-tRNA synthetase class 2